MRRRIGSLTLSVGLVLVGFCIMGLAAQLGLVAGGGLGRRLAMAAVGAFAIALAVLLWMHLSRERRMTFARVRWVWTRRDVVRRAVQQWAVAPSRFGVLEAAHGPCWDGAGWFPPRCRSAERYSRPAGVRRERPEVMGADGAASDLPVVTVEV